MAEPDQPETHVIPPAWSEAYNEALEFIDKAENTGTSLNDPVMMSLPQVQLPVALVRQILRLFDPSADF